MLLGLSVFVRIESLYSEETTFSGSLTCVKAGGSEEPMCKGCQNGVSVMVREGVDLWMPFHKADSFTEQLEACPSLLITGLQNQVASHSGTSEVHIHNLWRIRPMSLLELGSFILLL